MPNPNAHVSTVVRVDRERGVVELEGERRARLDPEDRRSNGFAQILEGLSKQRLPVYLELDPQTETIARLLIPYVTRVAAVRRAEGEDLDVELELSHARHALRRSSPDFDELERQLREAQRAGTTVIVTEDDAHDVIDIRPYVPGPEGPPFPFPEERPLRRWSWRWIWLRLLWIWWWCGWPWWWSRCVSPARAQQVFDAMAATSCDPLTVPAPCIPFLYPDDGCWARAHEMCRLMINMGLGPRKVWIRGHLNPNTRNNPACHVRWNWHVAPTICVCRRRWFGSQMMVIDPSLFTTPVTKAQWKAIQNDPNATLTDSDASDYLWGATDPTYTQTNYWLNYYRLRLQARALQVGPPPYANCP
jgi:Glutaminase